MTDSDEEYYEVPLRDQRYFGAGIKRRRVHFVPSTTAPTPLNPTHNGDATTRVSASERYLSVVFKKKPDDTKQGTETAVIAEAATATATAAAATAVTAEESHDQAKEVKAQDEEDETPPKLCDICNKPLETNHSTSLVHQINLPHAHPPSSLDRKRKGIGILQSHGWDPDARLGLGASGEGILHPVRAKEKRDTVGLGAGAGADDYDEEEASRLKPRKKKERPRVVETLDAGRIRKLDIEERKKDKRIRDMFYANEDVERYLGGG